MALVMNEGGSRNLLEGVKQNELSLVEEAMKQGQGMA